MSEWSDCKGWCHAPHPPTVLPIEQGVGNEMGFQKDKPAAFGAPAFRVSFLVDSSCELPQHKGIHMCNLTSEVNCGVCRSLMLGAGETRVDKTVSSSLGPAAVSGSCAVRQAEQRAEEGGSGDNSRQKDF